jgi:serine/threonine protein kinase
MWIVTELIHGRNLGQIAETAPGGWLHPVIAGCIVREICKALSVAHASGIVHRDVKPDNVMLTQSGAVKLMDFGIAKIQQNNSMTQTGMFMGSPSYMSPEQVRGKDVDQRSDIYSLGVLFYELVTGKLPFSGQSTADVALKILSGEYQHPKFLKDHVPQDLNDLIVSMMALDPSNRPRTTDTVARVLDQYFDRNQFESSAAELEKCFRDPKAYGERLARMIQQTLVVATPTHFLSMDERTRHASGFSAENKVAARVRNFNEAAIDFPKSHMPETIMLPQPKVQASKVLKFSQVPPPPQRRDHVLPKGMGLSKNSISKTILENLPERRHDLATRVDRKSELGRSPKGANQDLNNAPLLRTRLPRPIPRMPYRTPRNVHYVVHKNASIHRPVSSSFLPTAVAAFVIVLVGLFIIENQEKLKIAISHKLASSEPRTSRKAIKPQPVPVDSADEEKSAVENTAKSTNPLIVPPPAKPNNEEKKSRDNKNNQINKNVVDKKPTDTRLSEKKPMPSRAKKPAARTNAETMPSPALNPNKPGSATGPVVAAKLPAIEPAKKAPEDTPSDESKVPNKQETNIQRPEDKNDINSENKTRRVQISSSPAAEVYVLGRKLGTTNDLGTTSNWIDVKSESFKFELRRKGYKTIVETINLKSGASERLGTYNLERSVEQNFTRERPRLTLITSVVPANVSITNIETTIKSSFILNEPSQTIDLENGVYDVTIERNGDTKKRRIDFSSQSKQITFSASFKEETH